MRILPKEFGKVEVCDNGRGFLHLPSVIAPLPRGLLRIQNSLQKRYNNSAQEEKQRRSSFRFLLGTLGCLSRTCTIQVHASESAVKCCTYGSVGCLTSKCLTYSREERLLPRA
uniref:Uncharacterized protein n=1 Tax=Micrurus lemniscatus lemniscatus TaxID=129467 RepID=A0A2D4JSW2_MICLE